MYLNCTHTHTYIFTHIHSLTHIHTYTHTRTSATHMHTLTHKHHTYTHTHSLTLTHTHTHMCRHMYTHTHAHSHTVDREGDIITDGSLDQILQTTNKTASTSSTSNNELKRLSTTYGGPSALQHLSSRQLSEDPYYSLHTFKPTFYTLKSHVQRLHLERRLKEHEGCVNCIHFSHGGELLASGSDDLHIVLWDWAKGRKLTKFDSGHIANVFQVS